MKLVAFDIEVYNTPDGYDWSEQDLGISCAAICVDREGNESEQIVRHYYNQSTLARLGSHNARRVVEVLQNLNKDGYKIVGWNSLAFDFPLLAEESGMWLECAQLALDHVDMMLLVIYGKGWRLGLDAACKGMGVEGKLKNVSLSDGSVLEGMDGAKAPGLWREGEHSAVLTYLDHDVRATLALAKAIRQKKMLCWNSSSGKRHAINTRLWRVDKCLGMGLPDQSWMDNPPDPYEMASWAIEVVD